MVCGCSWSRKMYERNVAMSGSQHRVELFEDDAAQLAPQFGIVRVGRRQFDDRGSALRQVERIEPGEIAEHFRCLLVVGDTGEVQEVVRREIVADGRTAD